MSRMSILALAATAMLASPALASDQLVASLGVEPGAYNLGELAQLKTAIAENDRQRIAFIKGGGGAVVSTQSTGTDVGHAQLAASLGVEPGAYSLGELAQLKTAIAENDHQRIAFIRGGGEVVSTRSVGIGAGHGQLARSLGVDPGDYTVAQFAAMHIAAHDDD